MAVNCLMSNALSGRAKSCSELIELLFKNLNQAAFPAEQQRQGGAHGGLQNLEGQLHDGVFRGAVHKGPAQGIAHYGDDQAENRANDRGRGGLILDQTAGAEGDDHSLQTVGHQGDEHGRGVKQHIADESPDAAHHKGAEGVKQNGGGADDQVV